MEFRAGGNNSDPTTKEKRRLGEIMGELMYERIILISMAIGTLYVMSALLEGVKKYINDEAIKTPKDVIPSWHIINKIDNFIDTNNWFELYAGLVLMSLVVVMVSIAWPLLLFLVVTYGVMYLLREIRRIEKFIDFLKNAGND